MAVAFTAVTLSEPGTIWSHAVDSPLESALLEAIAPRTSSRLAQKRVSEQTSG